MVLRFSDLGGWVTVALPGWKGHDFTTKVFFFFFLLWLVVAG